MQNYATYPIMPGALRALCPVRRGVITGIRPYARYQFFARVAMFTKEAHEKALAEAEVEAAAAAAKKAAEEEARGAEQLSTALRMDARVSRRVLESSRLFDNAATDFKSRCCVSILWLVCVAMFLFVLLVAVRVAVKLCGADPSQCID